MQGVAPLSSLYYLDVYACSELAFMLVCFAKGVIDYTFKMFETVDQHISGKFRSDNIKRTSLAINLTRGQSQPNLTLIS